MVEASRSFEALENDVEDEPEPLIDVSRIGNVRAEPNYNKDIGEAWNR